MTTHFVSTVDYHTGGEPFRIVPNPPLPFPGSTVAERRSHAITSSEHIYLRDFLGLEPRGHKDMFGGFVVPPNDPGADFGVVFWSQELFNPGCGHGTMALGAWAVDSGRVRPAASGPTEVVIDTPSGRVSAQVSTDSEDGRRYVDFVNVGSFVIATDIPVDTTQGEMLVQLAYGGAVYAHVEVASHGLAIERKSIMELTDVTRQIREQLVRVGKSRPNLRPYIEELVGLVFFESLHSGSPHVLEQKNVLVYGDGQIDRSPCGSGTSSRMALLHATGELTFNDRLLNHSIIGSKFEGTITSEAVVNGRSTIFPVIRGESHHVGFSDFVCDPQDPLLPGFRL